MIIIKFSKNHPVPWPLSLFLTLLLGTSLLMSSLAVAEEPSNLSEPLFIRDVVINLPAEAPRPDYYQALARDVIFFQAGDFFSPQRLHDSLEALRISRKFEHINVESLTVGNEMVLVFELTPFHFIRNIRIRGTYPLFERDVLDAMSVFTGDAFLAREMPLQSDAIVALYRKEGYIDPQVRIQYDRDPATGQVDLQVQINKGPYYTLNRLTIEGLQFFSEMNLKRHLSTWRNHLLIGPSGRFTETGLEADLKQLVEIYRRHDFFDATVAHTLSKDSSRREVDLALLINEGPQYIIEFEGYTAFSQRRLKQELAVLRDGNPNDASLRRIRQNLLERYHQKGFAEARIDYQAQLDTYAGQVQRRVRFTIVEGPQTIIQAVHLHGHQVLDQETLKRDLLSRPPSFWHQGAYVAQTLETDLLAIQTRYLQMGYSRMEIDKNLEWSTDQTAVTIHIHITEGQPVQVRQVRMEGWPQSDQAAALALLDLQPGAPYRSYMLQSDQNALSAHIAEQGFPHVRVNHEVTASGNDSMVNILWKVDSGPFVRMGQVYFAGNYRTRESLLREALTIAPQEPFSMRRLLESQRNIRALEVFNTVQFRTIGLKERADTITLLAELEEKKSYYVAAGLGYETHKGAYVNTRLGDVNVWGRNKQAWISGELSEIGYRSDAGLVDPRFLGTAFAANFSVYVEERQEFNQNFGVRSYGITGGLTRPLGEVLQAGLNLRLERRNQFETAESAWRLRRLERDADVLATRTIVVGTPFIRYDSRDSYIRPRRGMLASLAVDCSKGLDSDLDDFFKYQLDWRYYFSPLPHLTLAGLLRAGLLDPYGTSDHVPDDQLFFLGGTTNIRGFKENMFRFDAEGTPLGGRSSISGSLEARWEMFRNVELTTFLDMGQLASISNSVEEGWRTTVGVGLRYITAIGPVGLLYGHKLDAGPGESSGRIHFSIGYTF